AASDRRGVAPPTTDSAASKVFVGGATSPRLAAVRTPWVWCSNPTRLQKPPPRLLDSRPLSPGACHEHQSALSPLPPRPADEPVRHATGRVGVDDAGA